MINRRDWLLRLAFVLTVAITGVSAVGTARKAVYWRSHMDEPIHGWMTVGYIAGWTLWTYLRAKDPGGRRASHGSVDNVI
jgi:hypothetical protein